MTQMTCIHSSLHIFSKIGLMMLSYLSVLVRNCFCLHFFLLWKLEYAGVHALVTWLEHKKNWLQEVLKSAPITPLFLWTTESQQWPHISTTTTCDFQPVSYKKMHPGSRHEKIYTTQAYILASGEDNHIQVSTKDNVGVSGLNGLWY